jgi:hypothetical protein
MSLPPYAEKLMPQHLIYTLREFAYEGGLMAYFTVEVGMYRRAADLVAKFLNGARPADLPVE